MIPRRKAAYRLGGLPHGAPVGAPRMGCQARAPAGCHFGTNDISADSEFLTFRQIMTFRNGLSKGQICRNDKSEIAKCHSCRNVEIRSADMSYLPKCRKLLPKCQN